MSSTDKKLPRPSTCSQKNLSRPALKRLARSSGSLRTKPRKNGASAKEPFKTGSKGGTPQLASTSRSSKPSSAKPGSDPKSARPAGKILTISIYDNTLDGPKVGSWRIPKNEWEVAERLAADRGVTVSEFLNDILLAAVEDDHAVPPVKIVGSDVSNETECAARLAKGTVTRRDVLQALANHMVVNAFEGDAWERWQNACLSRAIAIISGGKAVAA
ncbi:MAG TPA: hypothetical protein PLS03_11070 [Terrimicrobiaceae bacterium]|nr:hypothetical protein [Terrimicrobiaceae bacterium]